MLLIIITKYSERVTLIMKFKKVIAFMASLAILSTTFVSVPVVAAENDNAPTINMALGNTGTNLNENDFVAMAKANSGQIRDCLVGENKDTYVEMVAKGSTPYEAYKAVENNLSAGEAESITNLEVTKEQINAEVRTYTSKNPTTSKVSNEDAYQFAGVDDASGNALMCDQSEVVIDVDRMNLSQSDASKLDSTGAVVEGAVCANSFAQNIACVYGLTSVAEVEAFLNGETDGCSIMDDVMPEALKSIRDQWRKYKTAYDPDNMALANQYLDGITRTLNGVMEERATIYNNINPTSGSQSIWTMVNSDDGSGYTIGVDPETGDVVMYVTSGAGTESVLKTINLTHISVENLEWLEEEYPDVPWRAINPREFIPFPDNPISGSAITKDVLNGDSGTYVDQLGSAVESHFFIKNVTYTLTRSDNKMIHEKEIPECTGASFKEDFMKLRESETDLWVDAVGEEKANELFQLYDQYFATEDLLMKKGVLNDKDTYLVINRAVQGTKIVFTVDFEQTIKNMALNAPAYQHTNGWLDLMRNYFSHFVDTRRPLVPNSAIDYTTHTAGYYHENENAPITYKPINWNTTTIYSDEATSGKAFYPGSIHTNIIEETKADALNKTAWKNRDVSELGLDSGIKDGYLQSGGEKQTGLGNQPFLLTGRPEISSIFNVEVVLTGETYTCYNDYIVPTQSDDKVWTYFAYRELPTIKDLSGEISTKSYSADIVSEYEEWLKDNYSTHGCYGCGAYGAAGWKIVGNEMATYFAEQPVDSNPFVDLWIQVYEYNKKALNEGTMRADMLFYYNCVYVNPEYLPEDYYNECGGSGYSVPKEYLDLVSDELKQTVNMRPGAYSSTQISVVQPMVGAGGAVASSSSGSSSSSNNGSTSTGYSTSTGTSANSTAVGGGAASSSSGSGSSTGKATGTGYSTGTSTGTGTSANSTAVGGGAASSSSGSGSSTGKATGTGYSTGTGNATTIQFYTFRTEAELQAKLKGMSESEIRNSNFAINDTIYTCTKDTICNTGVSFNSDAWGTTIIGSTCEAQFYNFASEQDLRDHLQTMSSAEIAESNFAVNGKVYNCENSGCISSTSVKVPMGAAKPKTQATEPEISGKTYINENGETIVTVRNTGVYRKAKFVGIYEDDYTGGDVIFASCLNVNGVPAYTVNLNTSHTKQHNHTWTTKETETVINSDGSETTREVDVTHSHIHCYCDNNPNLHDHLVEYAPCGANCKPGCSGCGGFQYAVSGQCFVKASTSCSPIIFNMIFDDTHGGISAYTWTAAEQRRWVWVQTLEATPADYPSENPPADTPPSGDGSSGNGGGGGKTHRDKDTQIRDWPTPIVPPSYLPTTEAKGIDIEQFITH